MDIMKSDSPILLVEDDKIDALTVKMALKEIKVINDLIHVSNGLEALTYLNDKTQKRPCIILLDLNMPKMNGIEFLEQRIKNNDLTTIPVIVLSTSKADSDKLATFKLNIAGYMIKPVDYKKFVEVMRAINVYWTLSESVEE